MTTRQTRATHTTTTTTTTTATTASASTTPEHGSTVCVALGADRLLRVVNSQYVDPSDDCDPNTLLESCLCALDRLVVQVELLEDKSAWMISTAFSEDGLSTAFSTQGALSLAVGPATQALLFEIPAIPVGKVRSCMRDMLFNFARADGSQTISGLKAELHTLREQLKTIMNAQSAANDNKGQGSEWAAKRVKTSTGPKKAFANKINPSQPKRKEARGVVFDEDADSSGSEVSGVKQEPGDGDETE